MIDVTITGSEEAIWRAGAYLGISADFEDEPRNARASRCRVARLGLTAPEGLMKNEEFLDLLSDPTFRIYGWSVKDILKVQTWLIANNIKVPDTPTLGGSPDLK